MIIEEYEGQKVNDMQKYDVDIFAIGSDWLGKFDYLNDYCKVVYLERTKGVSSTQLRNEDAGILRIGVVGTGRIAHRFVDEAVFVSGVDIEGAWSREPATCRRSSTSTSSTWRPSRSTSCSTNRTRFTSRPRTARTSTTRCRPSRPASTCCARSRWRSPRPRSSSSRRRPRRPMSSCMEAIKTAYSPGFKNMIAVARRPS